MSVNLTKKIKKYSRRGPNHVLVGDLSYAGLPGKVYSPAEGEALPGIAFGHDWLKNSRHYHATLRHLASWGIVVVAPDTETGINPDHQGFAADLETALQVLVGVRLGAGNITVAPGRLGLFGHGMGAGAAVLAATGHEDLKSVVAAYPAQVSPAAELAAPHVPASGLVIGSGDYPGLDYGNAPAVAQAWKDSCLYREWEDASHTTLHENAHFRLFSSLGKEAKRRENIVGFITGYLLATLNEDRKLSGFTEQDAEATGMRTFDAAELKERADLTEPRGLEMPF
ncbi:alpha/beta hydrolase [Corynebacterium sp. ES2794-CONJ1]|uniref:dienelactone hydrolase family protein n=1 Tax=unclassified Corynebacterium TaxID=2624378 RepID=UPI00216A9A38|nr:MULTISPECIES: alpha/beta hydrolase [unclassified Corynebacterium]MCS4489576.1 alpha/beta hydrolase [Corynebacterium sp. ES2775-CONJ]MCS4531486.1 alpha/beta hydrolase [Corynebacterium sp. ES2730-CONJ]MCU9518874.1 alpha/beta hydrolase [Corynebacterium sp. ES2794-CONJ1]